MIRAELLQSVRKIAAEFKIHPAALAAFVEIESSGSGFNKDGKLYIQFEPNHFKKYANDDYQRYLKGQSNYKKEWEKVLANRIQTQVPEWEAFNAAWKILPYAAMMGTSIGLGQIMGFNHSRLGYKNVGEMWDDAKKGEERQIWQIAKFIQTDAKLYEAIKTGDWHTVAVRYNGAGYKTIAAQTGREPYNISMAKAYGLYKTKF